MLLLVIYVALALAVSFTCSLLEATLLSITPSYVALLEQEKNAVAARLRALKDNVDEPLAAILSLNTVAHTVGAAGAGAQAAKVFGDAAVGVFSGVLTLLVLVLSEIIPKSLGTAHWKSLAPRIVPILRVFMVVAWPLVKLAAWLTRLVTPAITEPTVNREEIAALASEGHRAGVVEEGESRVLRNLMRLSRLCVHDVMTPLEHLFALPVDARVREIVQRHPELEFSRIPLYTEERGRRRYTTYTLKDDILARAAVEGDECTLRTIGRDAMTVGATTRLPEVFDLMAERREHLALATDASGDVVGVITMEDIIETLLGVEIFDETDDEERIHDLARQCWARRARRTAAGEAVDAAEAAEAEVAPARPRTLLGITGAATESGPSPAAVPAGAPGHDTR